MKKRKKQSAYERFMSVTDEQKAAEVSKFDAPADAIKLRPLSRQEKSQWSRINRRLRRPGRPKIGKGVKRVMVSFEAGLLDQADAFARRHHLKRSELVAMAIQTIMSKAG